MLEAFLEFTTYSGLIDWVRSHEAHSRRVRSGEWMSIVGGWAVIDHGKNVNVRPPAIAPGRRNPEGKTYPGVRTASCPRRISAEWMGN